MMMRRILARLEKAKKPRQSMSPDKLHRRNCFFSPIQCTLSSHYADN